MTTLFSKASKMPKHSDFYYEGVPFARNGFSVLSNSQVAIIVKSDLPDGWLEQDGVSPRQYTNPNTGRDYIPPPVNDLTAFPPDAFFDTVGSKKQLASAIASIKELVSTKKVETFVKGKIVARKPKAADIFVCIEGTQINVRHKNTLLFSITIQEPVFPNGDYMLQNISWLAKNLPSSPTLSCAWNSLPQKHMLYIKTPNAWFVIVNHKRK